MSATTILSDFAVNEVELVYRRKTATERLVTVSSSLTANKVLRQVWNKDRFDLLEEFKILLLDNKSGCLGVSHVSTGGMSQCLIDPKVVFAIALKATAKQIILAHNHPSGNLKPSREDIALTEQLVKAGKFLDIRIADHIILTSEGYRSFADDGLLLS